MRLLAAAALICLTAACSQGGKGESAEDYARRMGSSSGGPVGTAPAVGEVNAQPVVAPTGAAQLTPLVADAPKSLGKIAGGCSFVYQGRSLLVAGADDASGAGVRGVAVVDGREVSLPGSPAGAAQALARGVTLAAKGLTVKVTPGKDNAGLTITGPAGQTVFGPGSWTCTP